MKLEDAAPGYFIYTQLARTALAVVVRRVEVWAIYVAGVPGRDHALEAHEVPPGSLPYVD